MALTLALAACAGGAASSPAPGSSASPSAPSTIGPSTDPDQGVVGPSDPGPGAGAGGADGGDLVMPHPGTVNPHPVAVETIETNLDGRHLTVKLTWTSGVEPCYVLDSVVVSREGTDIALTVVEGSADPSVMCIEIAKRKSTIVDLGELEPGVYTIRATDSQIPPVTAPVT
jgi:hypothetical protein